MNTLGIGQRIFVFGIFALSVFGDDVEMMRIGIGNEVSIIYIIIVTYSIYN
jgi:hypothetical protein